MISSMVAERDARDAERAAALPGFIKTAAEIDADFSVRVHTAEQFAAVLTAIGGHNNYLAHAAIEALGPLVADAMQVEIKQFVSGPSIHFQTAYYGAQRLSARRTAVGMGERLSDEQRHAEAQRVVDAGRRLKADEISVRQGAASPACGEVMWGGALGADPYEIRLWWD